MKTIVIAWANERMIPIADEHRRVDMGELPRLERKLCPSACTWVLQGTSEDVERAKSYAATITDSVGARVYEFPENHPDPLGAARRQVVIDLADSVPVVGRCVVSWDGQTDRFGVITGRTRDGRWTVAFNDGWVDSYRSFLGVVVSGHDRHGEPMVLSGRCGIGCYLVTEQPD